jgi:hypothetical protein
LVKPVLPVYWQQLFTGSGEMMGQKCRKQQHFQIRENLDLKNIRENPYNNLNNF